MTGLLAAVLGVALATTPLPRASVHLLAEVDYVPATTYFEYHASLAFTEHAAFLGTPGGLYRLPLRVEEGAAELAALGDVSVTRVYAHDGRLYVLKPSKASRLGNRPRAAPE